MTEPQSVVVSVAAQTDVGKVRQNNEDNFLLADLTRGEYRTATESAPAGSPVMSIEIGRHGYVAAVSDGMGGALAGEVASQMAVQSVRAYLHKFQSIPEYHALPFSEQFRLALEQANKLIHRRSQSSPKFSGMGATFTGLAYYQGDAYLAQVGDSRAYVIRGHHIAQATKDQSLVNQLIDAGYITEEQAQDHAYKNVILQALGAQPDTVVVLDRLTIYRGDVILLCSDGLSNKVHGAALAEAVASCTDLDQACRTLVALANARGGEDNITVVLCRFSGDGLPEPPAEFSLQLERIERDESLPAYLLPELLDADMPSIDPLPDLDRTLSGAEFSQSPFIGPQQMENHPSEPSGAVMSLVGAGSSGVERNIVRILMGLMIALIIGAIMAVTWYMRVWQDRQQRPAEPVSSPMTTGSPITHPLASWWLLCLAA
ncbi:MAG: protein phosphatase 2C domain-containing protein [Acidobacteriota bacterium]|nr:protein phosphatase 2C domain-containing protein [Blastocatellia bacterium]MDW8240658.1 protein phosphatase 2C domain-containing protein [Acidobacteriota bacterium]